MAPMHHFKIDRTDAAEVAVAPNWIVKAFDIVRQIQFGGLPVSVDPLLDAFLFQTAEERLGDCVIPAVSPPAHAWFKVIGLAEAPPCIAPVLSSLIRVDQGLARPSIANSLLDRL